MQLSLMFEMIGLFKKCQHGLSCIRGCSLAQQLSALMVLAAGAVDKVFLLLLGLLMSLEAVCCNEES